VKGMNKAIETLLTKDMPRPALAKWVGLIGRLGIALKSITCTARPKNHSASADLGTSIGSMPRPWPIVLERAQHNYEPDTMPA
jgi:hypothetical protein